MNFTCCTHAMVQISKHTVVNTRSFVCAMRKRTPLKTLMTFSIVLVWTIKIIIKLAVTIRPVGRGSAMGASAPPLPRAVEVHLTVQKKVK